MRANSRDDNRGEDGRPRSPQRRRLVGAALLLCATLVAGAAARVAARHDSETPPVATTGGDQVVALEARLDRGSVREGSDGLVRLELILRGRELADVGHPRVPTDLVVVLDRSGSMQGAPIEYAKAAVRELIDGLGPDDRFALVSYASGSSLDLPLERATTAARRRWLATVAGIREGGGTHMASGLDRAHGLLAAAQRSGRAPRMILLSDGLANQGDHSLQGLRARAQRAIAGEYVLSAVGIGDGFDENVMSAVADAGTGNFYYLADLAKLAGVFADEFASARETVASALSVAFTPETGVRVESASGYPLTREEGMVRFHPGSLFAGQERRIWLTLHAPTGELGDIDLGRVDVAFAAADGDQHRVRLAALPELACVANDDDYYASFDRSAYRAATLSESVGKLKQNVAKKLADGHQDEAVAEVDSFIAKSKVEQLRAFGSVSSEEEMELGALRDTVSAPAAAKPVMRNRLGKQLLEEGRDSQRAGSKR